jgi:hypothetical protein
MKKLQLLVIINKAINEVLEETLYTGKDPDVKNKLHQDPHYSGLTSQAKKDADIELSKGGDVYAEGELDEARRYGVADADKAQSLIDAASGKAKDRIQQIVDAINAAGGRLSGGGIANALGVIQPQINNLLKVMVDNGILDIEGGKAFATAPAPGEEAPEEEPEMAGDETDLFVGKGDAMGSYYFPKDKPASKEEPATPTKTVSMAAAPKIGVWFEKHSDLIQAIINKTKTTTQRVVTKLKENEEIGSDDYKKSAHASKKWAKESLKELIDKLVKELKKVRQEDPAMYEQILDELKLYKFGPTNTSSSYNIILKQLNASDTNAKPVDAGDLELDDEEEEDTLSEPVMERLKKLANIK